MRLRLATTACTVLTSALVTAVGLAPPSTAAAGAGDAVPVPGCGAVLTADAYLVADLACGDGVAIRVGDGVTLDLRGRTLSGAGPASSSLGVVLGAGSTVRRGVVTGFHTGISAGAVGTATVERVTVTSTSTGLLSAGWVVEPWDGVVRVHGSRFESNTTGIRGGDFGRVEVRDSAFVDNHWGVDVERGSGGALLEDSLIEGGSTGLLCSEMTCEVRGGSVRSSAEEGVFQYEGHVTLDRTLLADNGTGFSGSFGTARVTDATFRGNGTGVRSGLGQGVTLDRGVLVGNGTGFHVPSAAAVGSSAPRPAGGLATASDPASDPATDTVRDSRFHDNGDGVLVEDPGAELGGNTAVRNSGWGLYAPGAVDLGGNRAWGNGRTPQCVGVVC
ncbi:right-handed parallel beta-helix repeat-containing protein [Thalassiella azotivora]